MTFHSSQTRRYPGLCLLSLAALATLAGVAAHATDTSTYVFVRQEPQPPSYDLWLTDWLATRDRMRLQDLWLSLHSPSPYEFYIDGEYRSPTQSTSIPFDRAHVGVGAYAALVGLEADQYMTSSMTETRVLAGLRVFGFSQQGTHINLQGGLVSRNGQPGTTRSAALGTRINFHIFRYAGIESSYYHLFPSTPAATDSSNQYSVGPFIDFNALRIYGEYFNSSDITNPSGFGAGFRFFF